MNSDHELTDEKIINEAVQGVYLSKDDQDLMDRDPRIIFDRMAFIKGARWARYQLTIDTISNPPLVRFEPDFDDRSMRIHNNGKWVLFEYAVCRIDKPTSISLLSTRNRTIELRDMLLLLSQERDGSLDIRNSDPEDIGNMYLAAWNLATEMIRILDITRVDSDQAVEK